MTATDRDQRRADAQRRQLDAEDQVLAADAQLGDRTDLVARQVRETAADIRDHREMRRRRAEWDEEVSR